MQKDKTGFVFVMICMWSITILMCVCGSCAIYMDYKKDHIKDKALERVIEQRNKVEVLIKRFRDKYTGLPRRFIEDINSKSLLAVKDYFKGKVTGLDKDYKIIIIELNKLDEYLDCYVKLVQGGNSCQGTKQLKPQIR